jgi:L-asparaginase
MSYTQKNVKVIFTGGTVAGNVAKSDVSQNTKSDPNSFLTVLENSINIIKENWNIQINPSIVEIFNVDSSNIVPSHWSDLTSTIQDTYDEVDAYIILHGTNTMGYSAAALSFALENINKPVIFTGAQVPLGYLGTDATTNLVNALRLAVWGYHEVKGVMAVFGSKIITGTRVKKGTDFDYDPFSAFQTGNLGQIGRFMKIDDAAMQKHVSYLSKSKPLAIQSRVLSIQSDFQMDKIISLTEFPGMSPDIITTLVDEFEAKAAVFRAFGAGDPNKKLFPAFEYLKEKKIPIVVTTQAPGGLANFQVNETGQYLKKHNLAIPAYDMSIESMSVKMGWLLGQKLSYELIQVKMLEDFHGEINIGSELI